VRLADAAGKAQSAPDLGGASALDRESAVLTRLDELFDFTRFPGVEDFVRLAKAAPECTLHP
jgi:hypothetical protein